MACSGVFCNAYGTGTTTCASHRAACATNRVYGGSADLGISGRNVKGPDVENLRANIMAEIDSYNNWYAAKGLSGLGKADPGFLGTGATIRSSHLNNLRATVDQLRGTGMANQPVGASITAANWTSILNSYNLIRQDCICNSDCACNSVCACHNDCGCNYSDERLKENIKFIGVQHGLNVYTWNYIWDAARRYVGVMAQELLKTTFASAVSKDANGYYKVNYAMLPVTGKEV
jgi:hypothetical protein